jgi:hypothetical protein
MSWIGKKSDDTALEPNISKRSGIKTASFQTETPEPASREVSYIAPEIVITYASEKEIVTPQFGIDSKLTEAAGLDQESEDAFRIIRSVTTTEAGEVYRNTVPAALFASLFRTPGWQHITLESERIKHTPYWTNQEVWGFEYAQE